MKKNRFFAAAEKDGSLDIVIYGDITAWEWSESDVSSYTLSKLIQNSNATQITVCINSYGGDVAEALAIYNALKIHPAKVTTRCDGFACSAASVVFMAGDERVMNEASLLMIHNAWTWASGNAEELRKQADDLETISKTASKAYLACVNISEAELQAMLDAESWITPEDALEKGFATYVLREESSERQQYSAKKHIIRLIRQMADGMCKRDTPGTKEIQGHPSDIPESPKSGFWKLFDKFND